jgi:hypothetical protein
MDYSRGNGSHVFASRKCNDVMLLLSCRPIMHGMTLVVPDTFVFLTLHSYIRRHT